MRPEQIVKVTYTNHSGETRVRVLYPVEGGLWFGANRWHPEQQWFLRCVDTEDGNRIKDFALLGFRGVDPSLLGTVPQQPSRKPGMTVTVERNVLEKVVEEAVRKVMKEEGD